MNDKKIKPIQDCTICIYLWAQRIRRDRHSEVKEDESGNTYYHPSTICGVGH